VVKLHFSGNDANCCFISLVLPGRVHLFSLDCDFVRIIPSGGNCLIFLTYFVEVEPSISALVMSCNP